MTELVTPRLRLRRARAGDLDDLHAVFSDPAAMRYRTTPYEISVDLSARRLELDRISAQEGIVATAYERAHASHSRIDQFARLYLFAPSSALYSCPLAMTDGAARFLEVHGDDTTRPVFKHLTSRDPNEFWTSGQWMTERTGALMSAVHRRSLGARKGTNTVCTDRSGLRRRRRLRWR